MYTCDTHTLYARHAEGTVRRRYQAPGKGTEARPESAQGPLPAPITTNHSLGGFGIRQFPHSPGGWAPEIQVWGRAGSSGSLCPRRADGRLLLTPHVVIPGGSASPPLLLQGHQPYGVRAQPKPWLNPVASGKAESPSSHTVRHRGRNSADESGDSSAHKGGPGGEIPGRKPHWADAGEGKTRAGVSETCHGVQFSEILTSWEKPQTFCSLWKIWGHEQGGDWNHEKKDYRQGLLIWTWKFVFVCFGIRLFLNDQHGSEVWKF